MEVGDVFFGHESQNEVGPTKRDIFSKKSWFLWFSDAGISKAIEFRVTSDTGIERTGTVCDSETKIRSKKYFPKHFFRGRQTIFLEISKIWKFHDFDTMSNSKLHVAYILNLRDILSRWHAILEGSTNRLQASPELIKITPEINELDTVWWAWLILTHNSSKRKS